MYDSTNVIFIECAPSVRWSYKRVECGNCEKESVCLFVVVFGGTEIKFLLYSYEPKNSMSYHKPTSWMRVMYDSENVTFVECASSLRWSYKRVEYCSCEKAEEDPRVLFICLPKMFAAVLYSILCTNTDSSMAYMAKDGDNLHIYRYIYRYICINYCKHYLLMFAFPLRDLCLCTFLCAKWHCNSHNAVKCPYSVFLYSDRMWWISLCSVFCLSDVKKYCTNRLVPSVEVWL